MIKLGVCFCQVGVMSQCKPEGQQRMLCDFYTKHSHESRCSFYNKDMNDHCWCPDAQRAGYSPNGTGYVEQHTEQPHDGNLKQLIDELNLEMEEEEASCNDCGNYPCKHLLHEDAAAQVRGGLSPQDLINICRGCNTYFPAIPV